MTTSSPCRTPSASSGGEVLADCGVQPSSAATTNSTAGTGPTPGEHVGDEPLVARDVDEGDASARPGSVVQAKPRSMVSPRRRSSAQRSGSMPGERADQRRLAVVDVPGGGDDVICAAVPRRAAATRRPAGVVGVGWTQRRSSRHRPSSMRADDRRVAGRSGAGVRVGQADRRSSAARARARRRRRPRPASAPTSRRRRRRRAAGQRAPRSRSASGSACSARAVGGGRPRSVASSAARVSLSTRSARASGWRRRRSTSSARPSSRPACGPPSSLSPLPVTRSAPARSAVAASGSSGSSGCGREQPAAEVGDHGAPRPARSRDGDRGGEPAMRKLRRVHLEHAAGVRADRGGVVGAACVRLVVPTSRSRAPVRGQQVRYAEAVADLHQLAAADHDLAARRRARSRRAAARRRRC